MAHGFRIDTNDLRPMKADPTTGFLRGEAYVSKVGVFPYFRNGRVWRELRHPDDVFHPDSIASAELAPVTLGHPSTPTGLLKAPRDAEGRVVGAVAKPTPEADRLRTTIVLTHSDAIEAVEAGISQISPAYTALFVEESGVYNGQPYDGRQTEIRFNHFAIVPKGRQGPDVGMRLDAADGYCLQDEVPSEEVSPMSQVVKVRLDAAQEIDLPEAAAPLVKAAIDRLNGKVEALESSLKKARTDAAQVPDATAAHLERVLQAKEIFGDTADMAKLVRCDAAELNSTMLKALDPDVKLDGKSPDFIAGMLEHTLASRAASKKEEKKADESLAALGTAAANAKPRTDTQDPLATAKAAAEKSYDEMLARKRK